MQVVDQYHEFLSKAYCGTEPWDSWFELSCIASSKSDRLIVTLTFEISNKRLGVLYRQNSKVLIAFSKDEIPLLSEIASDMIFQYANQYFNNNNFFPYTGLMHQFFKMHQLQEEFENAIIFDEIVEQFDENFFNKIVRP